jgi:hypothetical protein
MVRPPDAEIANLMRVSREIRDTADESGYTVSAAVRQHEAFSRTRGPASALERSLVLDAARRGASRPVSGSTRCRVASKSSARQKAQFGDTVSSA